MRQIRLIVLPGYRWPVMSQHPCQFLGFHAVLQSEDGAGISWSSVTKLSKGETVSMEVLMKICKVLNCDIGDIMELLPEEAPES